MGFSSPDEELQFLRAWKRVSQMADLVLEDCLERRLGLSAAVDVYLAQTARMVHARSGFVQLRGVDGPVLTRVLGKLRAELAVVSQWDGAVALDGGQTLFVAPLTLGSTVIGSFGLVLEGELPPSSPIFELVRGVAEQLDSAVLAFLALSDGRSPLQRLDELSEHAAFRPRGRIGRYELVTPLGTGGMAQVLVARTVGPEGLGRLVALKRVLPHLAADEAMVQQFLDEARIGLRLSHPNLVTFYDFGQAGGAYYIAMELVRGIDLSRVIDGGPLAPELAVGVVAQALAGLHAAHEARDEAGNVMGLVHRDLSPHNLMVGFDGLVKVLDFGVAKARLQRTVTLPGIVKGKPVYMSPEQAVGDPLDRRSDLFAMGIILYEALTGTIPFDRGDDTASMEAIVTEQARRDARIPKAIWEVLCRALEKDPNRRYRSALELRDGLVEAQLPADPVKLSRMVSTSFPERLAEYAAWDRIGAGGPAPKADEPPVDTMPTRAARRVSPKS